MKIANNKISNPKNLLYVLWVISSLTVYAQNSQKATNLIPYPYGMEKEWSSGLDTQDLSPNGDWILFTEYFPIQESVSYLKHRSGSHSFIIPASYDSKFSKNDKWFGSNSKENKLTLIALENQKKEILERVNNFDFSYTGTYLAVLQNKEEKASTLKITHLETKEERTFNDVVEFRWNPAGNNLLLIKKEGEAFAALLYDANKEKVTVLKRDLFGSPTSFKWNKKGTAAVLMIEKEESNVLQVLTREGEEFVFQESLFASQLPGFALSNKEPFISDDGSKVLFYRQKKDYTGPEKDKIEVWDTTDPVLYPYFKLHKDYISPYFLTAWYPSGGILKEIETEALPTASMDINHDFALVYGTLNHGPQYVEYKRTDFYMKDIKSGKLSEVVTNQPFDKGLLALSPTGKYITYYKDNHWWVFDTDSKEVKNLSSTIKTDFKNRDNQYPEHRMEVHDKPYWTQNDEVLILADDHDLWALKPDGSMARRITNGMETDRRYRINLEIKTGDFYRLTVGSSLTSGKVDLKKGQLLSVSNEEKHQSGFAFLNNDLQVKNLLYKDDKISNLYMSMDGNDIFYTTENTTKPVAVHHYNLKNSNTNSIYQTNQELLKYELGHKEFITYMVDGEEQVGTLIYPANYDPDKKYPMVLKIYEKNSNRAIEFAPPNGYDYDGFTTLAYTTSGYFVYYPNFKYTMLQPGISAVRSVNIAVDKALENKSINSNKIGLVGHSFGGYEAAFIATQTDRFAAIVAGAAVTNFTSHYHGVNRNHLDTDMWRYEDQQWRMGVSYYKNKQAYLDNSPLEYVENVNTPLLLWTGDRDYQITWTQSIEMFMAMRRLQKIGKLILIKDEGHSPNETDNQLLLSLEIKKWLDNYCLK